MTRCPRCSEEIRAPSKRCPSCGAELSRRSESLSSDEILKRDLEAFVEETDPGDLEARDQILNWHPSVGEEAHDVSLTEEETEPVVVYEAPDEVTAKLAASLLETNGIVTMTVTSVVTPYGTTTNPTEGIWGRILVRRKDFDSAKELLAAEIVERRE